MKNTNFKLKTKVLNRAISITVLLLVAGVLVTGCPTGQGKPGGGESSVDKTYTVGSVAFTMKGIAAVNDVPLGHDDYDYNKPHTVSLSAYLIGETEVTQELWQAVMGNNPSHFENLSFDQIPTYNNADWNKAELDMNKNGFRLPTEAEWEWAAKGGKEYQWAGTNTEAGLKNYAWYRSNSGSKTHEVKKKSPNGYGLYDMTGNTWEWYWDWYGSLPASSGADYAGPASGSYRVLRGGSWGNNANYCAVGIRYNDNPGYGYSGLGFRLACRL